ncbi:hypothetical protein AUG19_01740 [archaeon 13_1_20CM_2_54_9]|nr:MAG: hypothetical protein AUG19_01740 [archaeon 13_1_20CM_2_54_9]
MPSQVAVNDLVRKIKSKQARVCVVGLGYVGVPLSVASAEAGFNVAGVDTDRDKVGKLNAGLCYVEDAYSEKLLPSLVSADKIHAFSSLKQGAEQADVIIICVPTPLDKKGGPDLSYVKSVGRGLAGCLSGYKLVILESTSYPGTTQEVLQPLLEHGGKKAGRDFALVYSPERIDYGNPRHSVKDINKVVGGIDEASTKVGTQFYKSILSAPVTSVSSPAVAEAAKILENIFRYVNIALVNELSILHEALGVDFIEAIDAAATKPFGFMPHYPGPGIGGHCIPKDPFYLVYKAKQTGLPLRLVSAAEEVNKLMPVHVVSRLLSALKVSGKKPEGSTVALWGLAYKGEVRDTRRSPALEVIRSLEKRKVRVVVYDPYVPKVSVDGKTYQSASSLESAVKGADCVLITTNHNAFRKARLKLVRRMMNRRPILFDTKNMLKRVDCENAGLTYLSVGRP